MANSSRKAEQDPVHGNDQVARLDAADISWTPSTLRAEGFYIGCPEIVLEAGGTYRIEGGAFIPLDEEAS